MLRNEYKLDTHLGAYLYRENYIRPNGVVGSMTLQVLEAYLDASGSESTKREKVLTVNGCLSTPAMWQTFDTNWQAFLEKEGFKSDKQTGRYVFHSTSFWYGKCKWMPDGLRDDDKRRIYNHLLDLIHDHVLYIFGYAVFLDEYRRFEEEYPFVRELFKSPGTYVSRECFKWNSSWANRNGYNSSIPYMFESGDEFWGEVSTEYHKARRLIYPDEIAVASIGTGKKAEYSHLQAADIVAWEARKYFLSLSKGHVSGLITPKKPRQEFRRMHLPASTDIRIYGFKDLESDLHERTNKGMNDERTNLLLGPDSPYKNMKEVIQGALLQNKNDRDEERQKLRDEYFRKRGERKNRGKERAVGNEK